MLSLIILSNICFALAESHSHHLASAIVEPSVSVWGDCNVSQHGANTGRFLLVR